MDFTRLTRYFLPSVLKNNPTHARYDEFHIIITSTLVSMPLVFLFGLFVITLGKSPWGYFLNVALVGSILLSVKYYAHYRIPMTTTAVVTYFIIYDWIVSTGLIYSPNMSVLHMYLLGAVWVDKKYGWFAVFSNLLFFSFIYYQTMELGVNRQVDGIIGSAIYSFGINCLITIFFGGFLAYQQITQTRTRARIHALQDEKISMLDEAVKKRTEQLNSMRQTVATDFHDQTGNMLSTITRQASLLQSRLQDNPEALPIVQTIIRNSNELYASSKDFLWNLNHDSDDPIELFYYLTGYGQTYYNQFDIAFSSENNCTNTSPGQLDPQAALNLIFIFKEVMTNVTRHSGATEVELKLSCDRARAIFELHDNGNWKTPDEHGPHYGLENLKRRCGKYSFEFVISTSGEGTVITIGAPIHSTTI